MNKLGYPLRITDLLSVVHLPEITDRFRRKKKTKGAGR
jgi:hypothetical protein